MLKRPQFSCFLVKFPVVLSQSFAKGPMFFLRSSKKRAQLTDQELITAYRESGDSAHVGELFERYSVQIYGICKRYLKDEDETRDAAMEVFEYLLVELRKYEIQTFKSWLARATSNFCLMRLRKGKSLNNRQEEYKKNTVGDMESEANGHHVSEAAEKEVELQALEAAILELKNEQKACIELFFMKGKSYDEVAELTGYSFKQVKSHIQNGKRNLKIRLERQNE
ncbi:MAG TPA: sigma-70 family RNA polymerase sigma factor [Bacteroidetes bacterium]|nr:sigma-70 family RNA polymerase sigma factor [Bacteroidota bacterium]